MTTVLIIGGVLIVVLIIVGIIVSMTSERALVEERLGKYLEEDTRAVERQARKESPLTDLLNRRLEGSSIGGNISRALARADMKFKPAEFVALIVIASVGLGAITWLIGGRHPVSFTLGVIIGAVLPIVYMRQQQAKRLQKFNDQLPDMINLMVNGLRAGYSTMQALEAVSRELPAPICDEFRRVVQEMQLGIPMERALDNLLRRIPSDDLDFLITAINVQREVGGPLAEILDTISFTIRERIRIKGEIRVMTSQVVFSARLLSLLPFVLATIIWFINQDYMLAFAENPTCGMLAGGTGVIMIVIGYIVMMKIANIEV